MTALQDFCAEWKNGGKVTFPAAVCVSVSPPTGSCETAGLIWGFGWFYFLFFCFFSTLFQHVCCICCVRQERAILIFFLIHVGDGEAPPTEVTGRFWVSHVSGSPHLGHVSIRGWKTLNISLLFRKWVFQGIHVHCDVTEGASKISSPAMRNHNPFQIE